MTNFSEIKAWLRSRVNQPSPYMRTYRTFTPPHPSTMNRRRRKHGRVGVYR